jgi:uncharacterized protein
VGRNPRSRLWRSRLIAVDTNILVYAYRKESPFHGVANNVMRKLAEGHVNWCIAWPSVHEFIGVVTNPKIFKSDTRLEEAFEQLEAWSSSGRLHFLAETNTHLGVLQTLAAIGNVRGAQIHDARIAAICLQHGVTELWTADRDFSRFPKLKTRNPLVG